MLLICDLIFFGGLLISQVGSASAVTQSFSRVASFYGQVSNAHLGVTIDFADFGHFLNLLDKSLRDKRFHDRGLYGTSAIKLTRNFNRLRGALVDLQSVEVKMEQILEVEAAVLQISSMADKLFRGLEELMAGLLSFDLVHDKEVRREFRELRSAAFNKGYEVVFPSPSQVFQLPASFTG